MKLTETKIDSQTIYEGKIINVYKDTVLLENGKKTTRELVTHQGGVCVVAVTDDNYVYMVEQFRYPFNKVILEVPAGKIDPNEEPLTCGKRELKEEVGVIAKNYENLGDFYPTVGFTNEIIYTYLATDLEVSKQQLDEDEFINIKKLPLKQVYNMVMSGEIKDGKTQTAILKAYNKIYAK